MSRLDRALALWRETRNPAVAELVRTLGAHDELAQALRELTADGPDEGARRLEEIVARGPDPRVTDAVLEHALALRFRGRGTHHRWWELVAEVLTTGLPADHDFAALERRALDARIEPAGRTVRRVAAWLGALSSTAPPARDLTDEEQALLQELRAPPPRPPGDPVPGLLDAIAADPDDDGPRLVLADWLLERGDLRGRFIRDQLQVARGEPVDLTEAHALLHEHAAEWFGAAFVRLMDVRVERGFPVRAKLRSTSEGQRPDLLLEAPGLRTLRSLTVPRWSADDAEMLRLLANPALRNLRHLSSLRPEEVDRLHTLPFHLEHLELAWGRSLYGIGDRLRHHRLTRLDFVLSEGQPLPALRSIEVPTLAIIVDRTGHPYAVLDALSPAVRCVQITMAGRGGLLLERRGTTWVAVRRAMHGLRGLWLPALEATGVETVEVVHPDVPYVTWAHQLPLDRRLAKLPPGPVKVVHIRERGPLEPRHLPRVEELRLDPDPALVGAAEVAPQVHTARIQRERSWALLHRGSSGAFHRAEVYGPVDSLLETLRQARELRVVHYVGEAPGAPSGWPALRAWADERGITATRD